MYIGCTVALQTAGSMQVDTMRLQSLDDAVEDQRDAHCRDEETNDSGDCIDAHRAEPIGKSASVFSGGRCRAHPTPATSSCVTDLRTQKQRSVTTSFKVGA